MNVALGVGGGIAAYKAAELARALMGRGCSVEVVMTGAAEEFIRPLTFAALTGRKVHTSLFSAGSSEDTLSSAIEHIRLAQENEILVVAPATADLLAKFAHGLADDLLTTMYLAFTGRVVLAPAMNTNMW
jgi:phosphopantothenoylcysteine decarboxylase/phosphopantothenate--cysteine ligase